MSKTESIHVAVRIRPLNKKEITNKNNIITSVVGNSVRLKDPDNGHVRKYDYNFVYNSFEQNENFASQEHIFNDLGEQIINSAFQGYNCCIFAYGQTGSGKTYTMMGTKNNRGLIPRICYEIFNRQLTHNNEDIGSDQITYCVEASYLEIYLEKVYDLLSKNNKIRIRDHKESGPYVEGLTHVVVNQHSDLLRIINQGNKIRAVASTNMNERSSRSHAVFTINFTKISIDTNGIKREVVSKINLVDLAGSERVNSSKVVGVHFSEAIKINLSLSTLGAVINKLSSNKKNKHIPFRESTLTWLLKESLGGNSKTIMLATVSPADVNYSESINTLRYAANAKKIINNIRVNTDPNEKIINILKAEIDALRKELQRRTEMGSSNSEKEIMHLKDELSQRELLMSEKEKSWEDKLEESKCIYNKMQLHMRNEINNKEKQFNQERNDYKTQINKLTEENTSLVKKLQNMEAEIKLTQNKTITSLTLKSKALNEELKTTKKEMAKLKQNNFDTQLTLRQKTEQFNKDKLELIRQIQLREQRIISFKSNNQTNTNYTISDNLNNNTKLTNIINDIKQKQKEFDSIKILIDQDKICQKKLKADISKLQKKFTTKKIQIDEMQSQYNILQENVLIISAEHKTLKTQYDKIKLDLNVNKKNYEMMLKQKEELKHTIQTMHNSIREIQLDFENITPNKLSDINDMIKKLLQQQ